MAEGTPTKTKPLIPYVNPILTKITKHKLDGSNYLKLSKIVHIYLQNIDKDDYLTSDPPTAASKWFNKSNENK